MASSAAHVPTARADSGVSDERVSLPDGPGSIGGVGENVDVDPNMGLMRYNVKIEVPAGFSGMTPSLSLNYSSGTGNSLLGMGWNMSVPAIERMSLRGLPEYGHDDEFAVNGSDELVFIREESDGRRIYRARFEKAFVRYTWRDSGDGSAGYWTAEYPDGSTAYFGADEQGAANASAQVHNANGDVFRYHMVVRQDLFGHAMRYAYDKEGDWPLLRGID